MEILKPPVSPMEAGSGASRRTALLVLGMHRSGTSALARVLSLLGAALPETVSPPALGNELGHWEPMKIVLLHNEILASWGSKWSTLKGFDMAWFETPAALGFVERIKALVLSEYSGAPLFIVKDPRISLLFPLWSRALSDLDIACGPIIAIRNPIEIAQSIARREGAFRPHDHWPAERAGLLFLQHVLAAERSTRSLPRFFAHYDDLLGDWRGTARALGEALGLAWPHWTAASELEIDRFLSAEHRHHAAGEDAPTPGEAWAEWINPIYASLSEACSGRPIDAERFDQIAFHYGVVGDVL